MNGIIAGLAGAGGAANTAGGYYQNAMNNLVNATGSPAATTFGNEEVAALQPQFNTEDAQLKAQLAAAGITNSGAGKADFSQLGSNQAATIAGSIAPLYQEALGEYGNIDAAMPGAQMGAYQNAIGNFYSALSDAGSLAAGLPPSSTPGSGDYNPYANPYGAPGQTGQYGAASGAGVS